MQYLDRILTKLKDKNSGEDEFIQAVEEVLVSLTSVLDEDEAYQQLAVVENLLEPQRQIMFRVPWQDDNGQVHVNRGYRIEFNSALGPFKGGLRFHPSVNASVVKFLGFEQTLKNALTGLPLGGAKGGADFDPKGKSNSEIMRFCQSFMTEMSRHIGPTTDVPAGDIGVGAKEIGYLFGQYKRLTNRFEGVITGKSLIMNGSELRNESTGMGIAYFIENMLQAKNDTVKDKCVLVSGAGNVAIHLMKKLDTMGAKVLSCSDSKGCIYAPEGLDIGYIESLKAQGKSLCSYIDAFSGASFTSVDDYPEDGHAVWRYECDIAVPCATQNELSQADAQALTNNGCMLICEGANMPCTADAISHFKQNNTYFGPGKAANAGGVAVSQFEMAQNASMQSWPKSDVDEKLQNVMKHIFTTIRNTANEYGCENDLATGANIAGFKRVAAAMIAQGVV